MAQEKKCTIMYVTFGLVVLNTLLLAAMILCKIAGGCPFSKKQCSMNSESKKICPISGKSIPMEGNAGNMMPGQ